MRTSTDVMDSTLHFKNIFNDNETARIEKGIYKICTLDNGYYSITVKSDIGTTNFEIINKTAIRIKNIYSEGESCLYALKGDDLYLSVSGKVNVDIEYANNGATISSTPESFPEAESPMEVRSGVTYPSADIEILTAKTITCNEISAKNLKVDNLDIDARKL